MSDSNDVLEHGDWRHAADVISMITKYARRASQGQVPLYVATVAHVPDTDPESCVVRVSAASGATQAPA